MLFDDDGFQPPAELRTDEFLLRPIRASDAELDYEAVMESREFLRVWEQSTWPEDDFTLEANREDVEGLEQRHDDGVAFTYTVMEPTQAQCLGCVYIFPTDSRLFTRMKISAVDGARWSDHEAAVYFWVRQSRLADGLDGRLLDALGPWFEDDWGMDDHLVVTSERFDQQVALIESSGRHLRFRLDDPNATGRAVAFG